MRSRRQNAFVSKNLSKFQNIILTLPEMFNREMLDGFCNSLNYEICIEVRKYDIATFEMATTIAFKIDSAMRTASIGDSGSTLLQVAPPVPLKIGYIETSQS